MTLSAFPEKIPETGKIYFKFFPPPNAGPKINLVQNRYIGSSRKYLEPLFLDFTLTLKLRVVHIRKKLKNYFLKNGSNDLD